jgi:hypothetical protein
VPGAPVGKEPHPLGHVHRQLVGRAAEHVALLEQGGQQAGRPPLVAGRCVDHHPGQARVQRQLDHGPAPLGGTPAGIERAQLPQKRPPLLQRALGGRIEKGQVGGVHAPDRQLQGQPGQVDGQDLRLRKGPAGGVVDLGPQPVGGAGRHPSRPPGALVGRGPGVGTGHQPGEAAAGVVAGRADLAAVDHDPHTLDGEAGLGDVGGQHDPAAPGRGAGQGRVLVGDGQGSEQRAHVDLRPQPGRGQGDLRAADLARAGQEDEQVALLLP